MITFSCFPTGWSQCSFTVFGFLFSYYSSMTLTTHILNTVYLHCGNLCKQRSALSVAANCCISVSEDEYSFVRDSVPILIGRLLHQDKKSVESCCSCFSRLVENFASNPVSTCIKKPNIVRIIHSLCNRKFCNRLPAKASYQTCKTWLVKLCIWKLNNSHKRCQTHVHVDLNTGTCTLLYNKIVLNLQCLKGCKVSCYTDDCLFVNIWHHSIGSQLYF